MRLTLRTLLAWRDGLLAGPEREELSSRVTVGSVAQSLLDRMEHAEQRLDVEPPKVEGRGLAADANTVAEYLENVLPTESLEAFERICLESDRHLAEVSACHAVLADTEAMRAATAASSTSLVQTVAARLAGGGQPRQPGPPQSRMTAAPTEGAVAPQIRIAPETAPQPAARRPREKSRKSSPWVQVAVAVGLLCVAGGGLGVVLWRNSGSIDARSDAEPLAESTEPRGPDAEGSGDAARPPVEAVAPETTASEAVSVASVGDVAEDSPPPVTDDSSQPARPEPSAVVSQPAPSRQRASSPPAAPEPSGEGSLPPSPPPPLSPAPPLGTGPSVPMGGALAIAAPLAPAPDAVLPPAAAPEPPEGDSPLGAGAPDKTAFEEASLGVVSAGPLVLATERNQPGAWRGLFEGEPVTADLQLLAPPAATPELDLGGVLVRLSPRSQVVLRADDAGESPGVDLELVFGSATVRRITGDVAATVRAGRLQWHLSGPPSAVNLQVSLARPPGGDPGEDGFVTASIAAVAGEASWKPLEASATPAATPAGGTLREGTAVAWSSGGVGDVAVLPVGEIGEAAAPTADRLSRAAVQRLAEAVREEGDLIQAARLLSADQRVECREVAAGTLALVGDYAAAAALLSADLPGERLGDRRWRAFEESVVPLALARGVHSADRWRQSLLTLLNPGEGERVYRLSVGFSDRQLADGGAAELVASLDDSRLVIRRYAALRLEETVDAGPRDRLRYRADAAAALRAEGVRWWTGQFEKGLIQRPKARQLSGPDAG